MIRPLWGRALAARIPVLLLCALVAGIAAPAQAWAGIEDCTVQGTSPRGTTINLFDYWLDAQGARDDVNPADYLNAGINAGEVLKFGKNMGTAQNTSETSLTTETVNYWTRSARPRTGIVDNMLAPDGYPRLNSARLGGGSLAYLFDREAHNGKAAYSGVKGLLQVDRQGYYYYNSQENFVQFNAATGMFTLFDAWGVKAGGASPNGQFFPFNTGSQVFGTAQQDGREVLQQKNVYSTSPGIKHYFGMTMSTRFVQQNGGHTNEERQTPVTYNFSGDDDVWIFIDGVLVGDLGGIHDKTSVSIDFSTGEVVVYWDKNDDNEFDAGDEAYSTSTLRDCFERAGVAASFSESTFADDTYHTLDFFYLERGNTDSNMSLRYNLVSIPESDVVKVDQASEPIAGVEFALYPTGENYEVAEGAAPAYTGHTDNSGTMTVLDGQRGFPVALSELEQKSAHWVLRETSVPAGYRRADDIPLYFDPAITSNTLLFSADPWSTGAYAQHKLTSTTTAQGVYGVDGERLSTDSGELPEGAWMFAVVMQKGSDGAWHAVMGNALDGWHMSASEGMEGVVEAAHSGDADRFALNSNGMYQTEVTNMPGDIKTYEWIVENNPGVGAPSSIRYTVQYFYTTASDTADVSADNTVRVRSGADDFERQFATRLYVANIENRLMVQKLDERGEPLEGAEFSLFRADDVTVADGKAVVNEGAQPVATAVTADLEITSANGGGSLTFKGALAFGRIVGSPLDEGAYYLLESQAPQGYLVDETPVKVVVDETGVYADAGGADDGVAVARGVGRVVGSMQQFTVDDDVDATLHDIKAALVTAPSYEGGQTTWSKPDWQQTSGPDATAMHLQYNDPGDNLPGAVFDYAPVDEGPPRQSKTWATATLPVFTRGRLSCV